MEISKTVLAQYKTPLCGFFGTQFMMLIDSPEDMQTVLTAKGLMEKGKMYRFFNRGVGLFAAPYSLWKPQRKQLSTSFNLNIIYSFLPIFNAKTKLLVEKVAQEIGKSDFDLTKYTSPCTLDIICGKFESLLKSIRFL